ncbi:MAG TPA: hypothetical protein VHN74_07635 [Candidatus Angelobacter sp.]|nr:hypothetical protein [Candidatus Angelobacter sp.]
MDAKDKKKQQTDDYEPRVGPAGAHNSGQMAADTPEQVGTTPAMPDSDQPTNPIHGLGELNTGKPSNETLPERAGIATPPGKRVRDRKVDHHAVGESYAEAQNDPIPETEPEEGEEAA